MTKSVLYQATCIKVFDKQFGTQPRKHLRRPQQLISPARYQQVRDPRHGLDGNGPPLRGSAIPGISVSPLHRLLEVNWNDNYTQRASARRLRRQFVSSGL